ncbi:trans-aconitate 2-methyltransferase [Methylopila capsulata]|nr:trans-aconitate 2-methyltransferase [Methylopila capsulata]MBM7853271.1 trans-aconitate 2-methyltransferase [Methylopila capsulata]
MRDDWCAATYLRFEDERTRPSADLLARVPLTTAGLVVDLGCGPGNSTELLARRFAQAEAVGVDTSPDMLAAARKRLPGARFVEADVATWVPERPADVIFANAVLQWLSHHDTLLPRLMGLLAPGGALAIQMPDNLDEPSHRAMREVALDPRWRERLARAAAARTALPSLEAYYDMLRPHAAQVDVWRTTYAHPLDGAEAIADWLKATGLRPFLDPLDASEREAFVAAYVERARRLYPALSDGKVLLRFPRLFIVATRA